MKRFFYPFLGIFIAVSFGVGVCFTPKVKSVSVEVPTSDPAKLLHGRLYSTTDEQEVSAAVVLVHGVIVNKEYMTAMAKTLAENGFAALTFDLGGYGESYPRAESADANNDDVRSAIKFLTQKFTHLENSKIGLVGHSMGGTTVIQVALEDASIGTAVCVGMGSEIDQAESDRFLFVTGLYDSFHSPSDLKKLNPDRPLYVSPTATHQTEMSNRHVHREISSWMAERLLNDPNSPLITNHSIYQKTCYTIGGILLLILVSCLVGPVANKRLLGGVISVVALVIFLLANTSIISPISGSAIIIGLLLALMIAQFWTLQRRMALVKVSLLIVGALIVIDVVNVINAIGEFTARPEYIRSIPAYLLQTSLIYVSTTVSTIRPILFSAYSTHLIPSWVLLVVFTIELIWPGICLKTVTTVTDKLFSVCDSKMAFSCKFSVKQLAMLVALFGILAMIGWQRVAAGFLNEDTLVALGKLMITRILPMIVLIFLLVKVSNRKLSLV